MLGAGRLSLPSSPSQLRVDLGGAATTLFLARCPFVCSRLQTTVPGMVL